jgi:hypothetical protein
MKHAKWAGLVAIAGLLALGQPAARADGEQPQAATGTAQPPAPGQGHPGERHPAAVRHILNKTQRLLVAAWKRCGKGGQDKDELRAAWIRQHAAWRALAAGHPAVAARLSLDARGLARNVIVANKGKIKDERDGDTPEETKAAEGADAGEVGKEVDASAKDAPGADDLLKTDPKQWKGHEAAPPKPGDEGEKKE